MAYFEFNEFNEFLQNYGYDTREKVLEDDAEAALEIKQAISYKDYVVTKDDYFRGCPTILKSEKAALSYCRKLYKSLKKQKVSRWTDPDFGPKNANDAEGSANSLYAGGKIPSPGYTEPENIEWIWSHERCKKGETLKFIEGGASAMDCKQGDLGDCWLISALSVCANYDELIVGGLKGIDPTPDMIVDK